MLHFPEFWWRERALVFGHRGASHSAPQNTLAAFRRAADGGADGVELDVQLSADGVPVVIHNVSVDATTDGHGAVAALTLAQLKELDAGTHFGAAFARERIPTLEEVLAEVGQRLFINIELKAPPHDTHQLEAKVAALVQRMGMQNRVWFSSFKPYMLQQIRKYAPEIPCGLLYGPLALGSLLFAPLTPHEALHPQAQMLTPGMVRRAHRRGLRVITWTVDDLQDAWLFSAWGVDGIISNEPEKLVAAFEK